ALPRSLARESLMPRLLTSIVALSLSASPALAQAPNPPAPLPPSSMNVPLLSASPPAQPTNSRVQVNPLDVGGRVGGNHWRMWAGRTLLKDFGNRREQAFEARRLIGNLGLTERDTIGAPEPAMEYWLTNGQAPPLPTVPRQVIPFDLATLKADRLDAGYCLR